MSRTSFDRSDRDWSAHVADLGLEKPEVSDVYADDLYVQRDDVLESDLFETSLEDYDDILSIAGDDAYDY